LVIPWAGVKPELPGWDIVNPASNQLDHPDTCGFNPLAVAAIFQPRMEKNQQGSLNQGNSDHRQNSMGMEGLLKRC